MALLVKLKNILVGSAKVTSPAENAPHLIGICIRENLTYAKMAFRDGTISLSMSFHAAKKLTEKLSNEGIEYHIDIGGIPYLLGKYKKRWGLLAGTAIIIAFLFLSGRHVWDIRVSGNKTLTASQVKAELAAVGFEAGSPIGGRDVDEIANSVLINSGKISWMSINLRGNVAYVQIREKVNAEADRGEDISSPANIVASRDGVIEYVEVMRGNAVVTERQSVREGDLLISGVSESTHGEYRTEHAIGRVYAITNHSFNVKIPLEYDKKELSDPVCTKKTLKFFSKSINFFRKGGNLGASCVKIEEENSFSFFGLPALPVSIVSELALEYETYSARRTEKEASDLAFFELEKLIRAELSDADLLGKTIRTEITEDEFFLWCDLICSENIALSAPISEESQ